MGLNELLAELKKEQLQTQKELDGLSFQPDFASSLEALVEGYEHTQEKKGMLANKIVAYREMEKLLIAEIERLEAGQREALDQKDALSLQRKESYIQKKLANPDISVIDEVKNLADLAAIRQQIRAKEVC